MYLVLIETSGNQNYIFSTNKLRENIGASELTYLSSTKWLIAAVAKVDSNSRLDLWTGRGSKQLRDKLLNSELNPPIENTEFQVEIILAASGKALLLVKEREKARSIIRQVTLQALKEAPGLDISGVIQEFDWDRERSLISALRQIHQKFEANRSQIPSPALRFLRLPVVEECASSGLPAATVESRGDTISLTSQRKRGAARSGFRRIEALLKDEYSQSNFADGLQVLDTDFDWGEESIEAEGVRSRSIEWLGVIHADGNGLGKIFINFPEHLAQLKPDYNNRDYANRLREFSLALDSCTERAFLSALAVFQPSEGQILPIFPLILGGDDLTVICDGKLALPFTERFLKEFEIETRQNETIATIAEVALKGDRLSACAGVAIVKPHFPFSVAYELAESLAKSAKQVKEIVVTSRQINKRVEDTPYPCSAIDFHIVYDSSGVELQQIRQRMQVDNGQTKLYRRPYVVTTPEELAAATGKDWVEAHHWNLLQQWIGILKAKDDEGKLELPNSQIYKLREDLALGKEIADSSYRLIQKRYRDKGITKLEGAESSLFALEPTEGNERSPVYMTGLLDAIEAADFLAL